MQIKTQLNKKRITAFFLVLLLVIEVMFSLSPLRVSAEGETQYSNVLDDMKKDPSFNPEDYPANPDDYSLKVIQVAESEDGELFLYVYQPSGKTTPLIATSANISLEHKDVRFYNYTLTFLNQNGVLQKYKVDNLSVEKSEERYYEITSIFRKPLNESESVVDNGNLISEVSFKVAKSFKITSNSDGIQNVYVEDIDVISVVDKYVGFMRYPNGGPILTAVDYSLDFHFVAFSTDFKIDQLLEADVYYTQQYATELGISMQKTYYEKEPKYSYLKFGESISYSGEKWYNNDYSFPQIESSESFLKTESKNKIFKKGIFDNIVSSEIDKDAENSIKTKEWVLRFAYTEFITQDRGTQVPYTNTYRYIVGDVSILRLAFMTDDQYYNLGVVDNKQSGDLDPDNDTKTEKK